MRNRQNKMEFCSLDVLNTPPNISIQFQEKQMRMFRDMDVINKYGYKVKVLHGWQKMQTVPI